MNINNILMELRRSRKLLPVSVYYSDIKPCTPADKAFLDEIAPTLKLLLKAFKEAGFTAYVSKWGELALHSSLLAIEVIVRVSRNSNFMSKVNAKTVETMGYEVLEVAPPRQTFVFSYFFNGTASKWRHIPFDTGYSSLESVFASFVDPVLKVSKPFRGRLKVSLLKERDQGFISHDSFYAFSRYAARHMKGIYGLAQFCKLSDEKYVSESFVGKHGAVLLTHSWPRINIIEWYKNDKKFFEKYLPQLLSNYTILCPSLRQISPESETHALLLESLDKLLLEVKNNLTAAEEWLGENHYIADIKPAKYLLSRGSGVEKLIGFLAR